MTDCERTDSTTTPRSRRRFPLTATALIGGALAVPLYLLSIETPESSADIQTAATASSVTQVEAMEIDVLPAGSQSFADKGEAIAMAAPDSASDGYFGSVVARRGLAEAKSRRHPASPPPPPPPGSAGVPISGGEGYGDAIIAEEIPVRARDGFDRQPQANILTAGRTSDLSDRASLDELRAIAIARDPALGQVISGNERGGPLPGSGTKPAVLDIGFVLDTTGSMGDELAYLKVEMRSIAQTIAGEFPGVQQRYALVAYKDHGDEYVVRHHDFEPLDQFVAHLGMESAGGGGDFPEAMDLALATTTQLQWSPGEAARMVFVVGDAPPHARDYSTYVDATNALAAGDVSLYPVASSGVETVCEYLMRWAARVTGGQYIFLTDHSGVGNPHADPHVDQYEVKTLRDHMLEVIRLELAGDAPPASAPDEPQLLCGHGEGPSWWDRHGLFVFILGGVFLAGFAGDMTIHHARARG